MACKALKFGCILLSCFLISCAEPKQEQDSVSQFRITEQSSVSVPQAVQKHYCLVVGDKVLASESTYERVAEKLHEAVDYTKEKNRASYATVTAPYTIEFLPVGSAVSVSLDEIVKAAGIITSTNKQEVVLENIPFDTVYKYGSVDGTVLRTGTDGVLKTIKNCVCLGDAVMEETVVCQYVSVAPIDEVLTTTDIDKISENTASLDAKILGLNQIKTDFINAILPAAKKGYDLYGIPISITLAQASLESYWGTSGTGNNLFGMKAYEDWKGKTVTIRTTEYENGKQIVITAKFKDYDSWEDSVEDYLHLIAFSDRYKPVLKAKTYKEAAIALGESGYATHPQYYYYLMKFIEDNKLYTWDKIDVNLSELEG